MFEDHGLAGRVVGAEQPDVAGLLAAEPIWTELSAGIGLVEVVHDEPFQLASSSGSVRGSPSLKIQTSESDCAVIASTPSSAKLDGVVITCQDVPASLVRCSSS